MNIFISGTFFVLISVKTEVLPSQNCDHLKYGLLVRQEPLSEFNISFTCQQIFTKSDPEDLWASCAHLNYFQHVSRSRRRYVLLRNLNVHKKQTYQFGYFPSRDFFMEIGSLFIFSPTYLNLHGYLSCLVIIRG